jgi:glyoxylase-like metal-dependent hydrolase (beta-lactamase superfamily II)
MLFKAEKLSDRVTRIFAPCTELIYLVEGDERAALLDSGSGIGSLKNFVATLTDKPITVLCTHGHIDHAMGAPEFDDVYLNKVDDYIYNQHATHKMKELALEMYKLEGVSEADFIPEAGIGIFKDLKDGDSFPLGGETIEIYDCPGHTRGSVVMLLVTERALLLGDACNYFTFMFDDYSTSITEYEESLKKLALRLEGKFDTVYLSHADGNGHKEMIEDVIAVCDDIKSGNTDDVPFSFMGVTACIAKAMGPDMKRSDGGRGNIVYNKSKI